MTPTLTTPTPTAARTTDRSETSLAARPARRAARAADQHPALLMWKVVEHAGELLSHPRTQLGLHVLTEVLVAAGGMSRPDAALARDAAEAASFFSAARRKRPSGPRVVIG